MNLVPGILFRLILWKFLSFGWLAIQSPVVHRSKDAKELLHIKINGQWREEYWLSLLDSHFGTPERLFSASKLLPQIITEPPSESLSRDVFLCSAGFLCAALLCIRRDLMNYFGQDYRKRFLQMLEKDWNTGRVKIFCVFIVQSL